MTIIVKPVPLTRSSMTSHDHISLRDDLMARLSAQGNQLDALEAQATAIMRDDDTTAPSSPELVSPFTYEGPLMPLASTDADQFAFDLSLADLIHEHAIRIAALEAKLAHLDSPDHPAQE